MTTLETTPLQSTKNLWPKGGDLERFYGKIEFSWEGEPTERWEARALQHLALPFSLRLAWRPEQTIRRIRVNRNCLKSLSRIFSGLERLREEFGAEILGEADLFGGCYLPLSRAAFGILGPHAYGAAIRLGNGSVAPEVSALFEAEHWKQVGSGSGIFAAIS